MLPLKKEKKNTQSAILLYWPPHPPDPLKKIHIKELVAFQISLPGSLSLKILLVTDASKMQAVLEHLCKRQKNFQGISWNMERKREREMFLKIRLSRSHQCQRTERFSSLERMPAAFPMHLSEPQSFHLQSEHYSSHLAECWWGGMEISCKLADPGCVHREHAVDATFLVPELDSLQNCLGLASVHQGFNEIPSLTTDNLLQSSLNVFLNLSRPVVEQG